MRAPAVGRVSGGQVATIRSLPAPVGGLNARDALANMPEVDATIMDNWFPRTTDVVVRNGYSSFATFTGICKTVIVYNGVSATSVFVAVDTTNDAIINATAGGAISTPVVGGVTPTVQAVANTVFDYVNFGATGGHFLSLVNGTDTAIEYDGTTWSTATITHADLVSTDDLFTNAVFSERLWFGENASFNVYYTATRAKSGATTKLPLASLFKLGGKLNSIITVTDATQTVADYIGFLSTQGELIAFGGDPASGWAKAAHFVIPRPVVLGMRAWIKYGTDALILTTDGVISLRAAIEQDRFDIGAKFSDKIRNAINAEIASNGSKGGWGITYHPTGTKIIVNVPTASYSAARQYVMNTQTQAWCRFTGWDWFHFAVTSDTLYAGGSGILVKADTSNADGSDAILSDALQAFNYFGSRGTDKAVPMIRPVIALNGAADIAAHINADFNPVAASGYRHIEGGTGDPWGASMWSAAWVGGTKVYRKWQTVTGHGAAIAPRLEAQTDDVILSWQATDVCLEHGGPL